MLRRDAIRIAPGSGWIKQPALDQRPRLHHRPWQHCLRRRVTAQHQLLVEDLAHFGAQAIGQIGADKGVETRSCFTFKQIELGRKFDMFNGVRPRFEQEVELANGIVTGRAHLQAMRHQ